MRVQLSGATWLAALVSVIGVLLLRDPAPVFLYDAGQYWAASQAVITGQDAYTVGGLNTRGVLTALVYLPAGLVTDLAGGSMVVAGWAVLMQNALVIAAAGAFVIPRLVGRLVPLRTTHVAASSALTVLALSGFAPYPLMDLVAVVLAAVSVLLLASSRGALVLVGGVALAVAVNLRPSYLVAAVLVMAVLLLRQPRRTPWALLGAGAVVTVQVWYGSARAAVVSMFPPDTAIVTAIQLNYSAYGVRYDTVLYSAADPRQWYCSPQMADAVAGELPGSNRELLVTFFRELPSSALFALEKVTASLQWSWSMPYAGEGSPILRPLGILVTMVTCAGLGLLVRRLVRSDRRTFTVAALLMLALGSMVTMVASSPEARFASPLVVAGVVGVVAAFTPVGLRPRARQVAIGCAAVAAASVAVLALGTLGLSDAAPRGDVTADVCRAT